MNEDTSNEEVVEETVVETPETTDSEPSDQQEEPQEESPRTYAGKYKSVEDLEKAYMEAQKHIASTRKKEETPPMPADKQQILDELKSLGVVTKEDLDRQKAVINQQAKDDLEIKELQISAPQEKVLRAYAQHPENLQKSMTECWDELSGSMGGKVVKRKTTLKPKGGTKTATDFKPLPDEKVAKLDQKEYDKYWDDFAKWKAEQ